MSSFPLQCFPSVAGVHPERGYSRACRPYDSSSATQPRMVSCEEAASCSEQSKILSEIIAYAAASVMISTLRASPPVPCEQNRYTCLPERSFSSRKLCSAVGTPVPPVGVAQKYRIVRLQIFYVLRKCRPGVVARSSLTLSGQASQSLGYGSVTRMANSSPPVAPCTQPARCCTFPGGTTLGEVTVFTSSAKTALSAQERYATRMFPPAAPAARRKRKYHHDNQKQRKNSFHGFYLLSIFAPVSSMYAVSRPKWNFFLLPVSL